MKNKNTTLFMIALTLIITGGCSKEDAVYTDNFGNKITQKTNKPLIIGSRNLACNYYSSPGSWTKSFNYTTTIEQTHNPEYYLIGPIQIISFNKVEKTNIKASFKLDSISGNFEISEIKPKFYNTKGHGVFNKVKNEISIVFITGSEKCECIETKN